MIFLPTGKSFKLVRTYRHIRLKLRCSLQVSVFKNCVIFLVHIPYIVNFLNVLKVLTFKRWESCLKRFVVGWFLDVIQECARIWLVVNLLLGSTSSICLTRSLAKLDTVNQLPESMLYCPFPILRKMSSGESSGPVAKGVWPASIVNRRTPKLHTSQAAS